MIKLQNSPFAGLGREREERKRKEREEGSDNCKCSEREFFISSESSCCKDSVDGLNAIQSYWKRCFSMG